MEALDRIVRNEKAPDSSQTPRVKWLTCTTVEITTAWMSADSPSSE